MAKKNGAPPVKPEGRRCPGCVRIAVDPLHRVRVVAGTPLHLHGITTQSTCQLAHPSITTIQVIEK
jgi:hypothetical protein